MVSNCCHPPRCVLQYTKLRLWELDEFSRIVYLDADTLVMGDITPLFHIPHAFAAVRLLTEMIH